jgi:RNA-splicing ligase RtcB
VESLFIGDQKARNNAAFVKQKKLRSFARARKTKFLICAESGMLGPYGSTAHGAGRALSRNASRRKLNHEEVLQDLRDKEMSIRVASP